MWKTVWVGFLVEGGVLRPSLLGHFCSPRKVFGELLLWQKLFKEKFLVVGGFVLVLFLVVYLWFRGS